MIVFELTMPKVGSWNGRWSLGNEVHVKIYRDSKELLRHVGKDYFYDFGDGWCANVAVKRMKSTDALYKTLKRDNTGFLRYDWMIESILKFGKIIKPSEWGK